MASQVPGSFTSSIPATVIPRKTSSESRRSRGGAEGDVGSAARRSRARGSEGRVLAMDGDLDDSRLGSAAWRSWCPTCSVTQGLTRVGRSRSPNRSDTKEIVAHPVCLKAVEVIHPKSENSYAPLDRAGGHHRRNPGGDGRRPVVPRTRHP